MARQVGQPSSLKLAYNAWVLTTVEGIAESLTLAGTLGVDPHLVIDVIDGSGLDSPYVQNKARGCSTTTSTPRPSLSKRRRRTPA